MKATNINSCPSLVHLANFKIPTKKKLFSDLLWLVKMRMKQSIIYYVKEIKYWKNRENDQSNQRMNIWSNPFKYA